MIPEKLLKILVLVFCVAGAIPAQANTLPDPSFQQGIDGWIVLSGPAQISFDTSLGFGDTTSLRAVLPSAGQATIGSPCLSADTLEEVSGSAEAFAHVPGAVCLAYPMYYENSDCTGDFIIIGTGGSWPTSPAGQWTGHELTLSRPPGFRSIRLALFVASGPGGGCNFDSVALSAPAPPAVPTLSDLGKVLLGLLLASASLIHLKAHRS